MNQLIAAFNEYFNLVHADSPELLQEVFRLRYRIFCEEQHWLETSLFPEQMESDEYDRRSVHMLLQHRPSGYYVGTVRLVLPDPYDFQKPFPTETVFRFYRSFVGVPLPLRGHVAEISRVGVLRHFPHHEPRRTPRYIGQPTPDEAHLKRRLHFPHPLLALAAAVEQLSAENEITHWYAATTPGFDRSLRHHGFHLHAISPVREYLGQLRAARFAPMKDVLDKAYREHPDVWELITDCGKLYPAPSRQENIRIETS
jgi:N-acyl amino acid synthase of PEP-CTERM/exosortase system